MQKSVNPIVAILIISFFASLLYMYVWSGQQLLKLNTFGLAKAVDDEKFVVQYGSQLLWVNKDFTINHEFSLRKFDQKLFTGDIDFFSNGDLLLALDQPTKTLAQELEVLNRVTNREADGSGALYRCKPETFQCDMFGRELPAINRTFRLYIDKQDQVFIADTTRHQLWLLDKDGKIIANKTGFRFPNQIVPQGENLVVADTNHHALKIIKSAANEFASEIESIVIGLDSPFDWLNKKRKKYSWPVNVLWVNNTYWVLVADNNLSYSRLALYNIAGKFERELKLPVDADPISMVVFDNKILIVDMALYRIHQYSQKGIFLGSVAIDDAAGLIAKDLQESTKWRNLQNNTLIVFALFVVFGFIAAFVDLWRSKRTVTDISVQRQQQDALKAIGSKGIWLEVGRYPRLAAKLILPLLFLVVLLSVVFIVSNLEVRIKLILPHFLMLLVVWVFSVPIVQMARWRLGIFQDRVELIDHRQERHIQAYSDLLWNDAGFKVGQIVVPFRKHVKKSLFPQPQTTELLVPFFSSQNKIGKWTMLKHQWHSPEKSLKALTFLIVTSSVFILFNSLVLGE
ncbi:hypothetical protein D0C16_15535 [Cellvibrio sp. KY-GH-1]|uniref:hypothetical protein n=1 Tax=Cellvibrio sp. KY-GH-1 TaxID=2303332 RepID=UPI0012483C02|nr:hypothetical protein [Cellvibrio sp. KY-GH-1]QEY17267.1 hypothetical protein D0C16_15535 [Cellvibrio sp. KY-GH-1]